MLSRHNHLADVHRHLRDASNFDQARLFVLYILHLTADLIFMFSILYSIIAFPVTVFEVWSSNGMFTSTDRQHSAPGLATAVDESFYGF